MYVYILNYSKAVAEMLHITKHSKIKGITLQAWRVPGGSSRLKLPDLKAIGTGWW